MIWVANVFQSFISTTLDGHQRKIRRFFLLSSIMIRCPWHRDDHSVHSCFAFHWHIVLFVHGFRCPLFSQSYSCTCESHEISRNAPKRSDRIAIPSHQLWSATMRVTSPSLSTKVILPSSFTMKVLRTSITSSGEDCRSELCHAGLVWHSWIFI